jgi:hypothetical protein
MTRFALETHTDSNPFYRFRVVDTETDRRYGLGLLADEAQRLAEIMEVEYAKDDA